MLLPCTATTSQSHLGGIKSSISFSQYSLLYTDIQKLLSMTAHSGALHRLELCFMYKQVQKCHLRMTDWMLVASEEATWGSVMAKHDLILPCSKGSSQRSCCARLPYLDSTCKHKRISTRVICCDLWPTHSPYRILPIPLMKACLE